MNPAQQGGNLRDIINTTLIKDFMIMPPIILKYNEKFSKVEAILREKQIKHLPILDENGRLGGLITLSDLYRTCSPRKNVEDGTFVYDHAQLDGFILKNVMTKDPFALKPDNTLKEALEVMVRGGFGCIPIVDDDRRIVGIITQTDMIRILGSVFGITKVKK